MGDKPLDYDHAIAAIDGNICRCTGYKSLERAARIIGEAVADRDREDPLTWLVHQGFLPDYFLRIEQRMKALHASITPGQPVSEAAIVGGGTDLFVQRPEEIAEAAVDLVLDRPDLKGIKREGGRCHLGASTTAEEIRASPDFAEMFPRIRDFMKLVSSTPIRNMGTVAGNFVNASPIGDLTIFFLALDSQIELKGPGGVRHLALKDYYQGYKTLDRQPDEYLERISFQVPDAQTFFNFEKVCKRTHLDIASVNAAICLRVEEGTIVSAGLSAGGVAPIPLFLAKTSAWLPGRQIDEETVTRAAELACSEVSPISDARGTATYKRLLLRQLIYAHFLTLFPEHLTLEALV